MWLLDKPSVRGAKAQLKVALTLVDGTIVYPLSAGEKAAIGAAYSLYDQQKGRHHPDLKTGGLTVDCRKAIHDAYNQVQKGGRLKSFRQSLLDEADICPFCGFSEPTQLDHYLPRSDYKALAIYARNLIPACGPCNNAKRQHVGGVENEFVHAYFDELPKVDFLIATVTMVGSTLTTTFSIDSAGLPDQLASSLSFQIKRMNLNRRYRKQVNLFMFSQRTAMLDVYEKKDGVGLRAYLRRTVRDLKKDFGRNDWRTAFVRGLLQCDAFCDGGVKAYFERKQRRRRASA